ncbi:MAG TPA: metallopeptidase TldD-related protein [Bacteriovoracaceae bacterium]|nr:metallopeptidase TldD-related protein [Bacteriovoracaceae bacterium]
MKSYIDRLTNALFNNLKNNEDLIINLHFEESDFLRFNKARARQTTHVWQANFAMSYLNNSTQKNSRKRFLLTGDYEMDIAQASLALNYLREMAQELPADPFFISAENFGTSFEKTTGQLPASEIILDEIFSAAGQADFVGQVVTGPIFQSIINSKGTNHAFATDSFFVDYSLFLENQKAVKNSYAGTCWSKNDLQQNLHESKTLLKKLEIIPRDIKRGKYRTYFTPSAHEEMTGILGWGGFSGASFKEGQCPFRALYENQESFSSKITLKQDFSLGVCPRFNAEGELAPQTLALIEEGRGKNLLVSRRSAKEFNLIANGANGGESPCSVVISPGKLKRENILKELGTGLYISNLHYLNFSDRQAARITGMTRYACFYVENGEIVAPINDLRFDESFYNCWGKNLIDLTDFSEIIPNVSTYFSRGINANKIPGILVDDFNFTL